MEFNGHQIMFKSQVFWFLKELKKFDGTVFVKGGFFTVSLDEWGRFREDSPAVDQLVEMVRSLEGFGVVEVKNWRHSNPVNGVVDVFSMCTVCSIRLLQPQFDDLLSLYSGEAPEPGVLSTEILFTLGDIRITYKVGGFYFDDDERPFYTLQRGKIPVKLWDCAVASQDFYLEASMIRSLGGYEDVYGTVEASHRKTLRKNLEKVCLRSFTVFPEKLFDEKVLVWEFGGLHLIK
jgi:hypothetical protein